MDKDIVERLEDEIRFQAPTEQTMQDAINEIRKLREQLKR